MAVKHYGLCETCEHDSTCTLRRSTRLKIVQCEEFSLRPCKIKKKASPKSGKAGLREPACQSQL